MVIINKVCLVLFLCFASYNFQPLFAQDSVVVILLNWRTRDKTPQFRSWEFSNDTIMETRGRVQRWESFEEYQNYNRMFSEKEYFLFYDKKGRIMMEGYWGGEGFYRDFVFYHKNGKVKVKGHIDSSGNCGEWQYFNRKGNLRKIKKHPVCEYY